MAEFRMPSLGADMETGTLVEWHVKPGDTVKRGEIIATVETQKGLFEVENFEAGVVEQLLVQPGTTVPVGTVLALLQGEGPISVEAATAIEAPVAPPAPPPAPAPAVAAPPAPGLAPAEVPPAAHRERIPISPSARRLAAELGVEVEQIQGKGPRGAIQRADVERAAQEKKETAALPAPPPKEKPAAPDYQTGMRQAIAAAMSRSNREIPHYYLATEIDMSRALGWLEGENQKRPIKERILPAVLLLKAVARGLVDIPELNGFWLDNRHQVQESINIGFAITLRQGGLITPAIHGVDLLSLDELMEALRDLISRTRSGRLRSSEMTDATITVTNLGDLGVTTAFGVIYPPQVALVGFGKISERPWAENGLLGVRRAVTATLSADHRATDGHRGSQFLDALNKYLQEPEKL
jgi:pyruvate dehydrogenase E2 component (dihydrolipoamide acetyltransferase)